MITTAKGLKPLKQCSQPGSLNPGAALESDGTVKRVNTRKHRHREQANEADQGLDQNGKRSGSGFLTWPDANGAPPVYRVDLTRPATDLEHGKALRVLPPWLFQGKPTVRQAQGETAWRGSNKPRPPCKRTDMPTSIGSLFARESAESSSRRKCK